MPYIKIIGLLCVLVAGAGCGIYASLRLKSRALLLEKYLSFLNNVEIRVRFGQCDINELLSQNDDYGDLSRILKLCKESLNTGMHFGEAWRTALDKAQKQRMIFPPERLLLSDFASFGTSDVEGEISRLNIHLERVTQRYKELLQESLDKGKLYRTLGFFGGAAVALIAL